MARNTAGRLLAIVVAALIVQPGLAQKCYYPNGSEAPDTEKPCSSVDGSACCPDTWECLDNGLCHNPTNSDYGRYSCTDPSWNAEGCPSNLCTYDMAAAGGEGIHQCPKHNNDWCCDADRTNVHCCEGYPQPRPFFHLQDGKVYATIGKKQASANPNLATVTGLATSSAAGNSKSSSKPTPASSDSPTSSNSPPSPSSSDRSSSTPAPTPTATSLLTVESTGASGVVIKTLTSVLFTSQTPDPSSDNASSDPPSKKSNLPVIVGCALGIPLALLLAGILIWLLRKRSRQNAEQKVASPTPDLNNNNNNNASPTFAGAAMAEKHRNSAHGPPDGVPELMGQSVGPDRPVSTIVGKAELGSGNAFAPGAVPYGPNAVGLGGGTGQGRTPPTTSNSWATAPPGYSPGMNQNAWAHGQNGVNGDYPAGLAEAPDTSVSRPTSGNAGVGVVGMAHQQGVTEGGRYIPYRPPQGHAAATQAGNLSGVPEVSEMPTVRTPPEERGLV